MRHLASRAAHRAAGPKEPAAAHVVLGLGNLLNRDEGLGVHALQALEAELGESAAVSFVDGGVLGLDLLPLVERCSHLLLLDAVDAGAAAGSIVELTAEDLPRLSGAKLSLHQTTFQDVLALAAVRGRLPQEVHLVGVQPADLSLGVGLSAAVAAALPSALQRATAVLRRWGLLG